MSSGPVCLLDAHQALAILAVFLSLEYSTSASEPLLLMPLLRSVYFSQNLHGSLPHIVSLVNYLFLKEVFLEYFI